jgi:hypothetical protein
MDSKRKALLEDLVGVLESEKFARKQRASAREAMKCKLEV